MTVALILITLIAGTGLVLYLEHRSYLRRQARNNHGKQAEDRTAADAEPSESESEECCGMHITCEKDSLLASRRLLRPGNRGIPRYPYHHAAARHRRMGPEPSVAPHPHSSCRTRRTDNDSRRSESRSRLLIHSTPCWNI